MFSLLKIGSAFRYTRNIVGGLTGLLFTFANIFTVPMKGVAPVSILTSLGLSLFTLKMRENYRIDVPCTSIDDYRNEKIKSSTILITDALDKKAAKINALKKNPTYPEQKDEKTVIQISHYEIENMIKDILNDRIKQTHNWENFIHKYVYCTTAFLSQFGSHFMECLLAKSYVEPDLFGFNELSADNIFIVMVSLLALYNGLQSFNENYVAYEKSLIDDSCEKVIVMQAKAHERRLA